LQISFLSYSHGHGIPVLVSFLGSATDTLIEKSLVFCFSIPRGRLKEGKKGSILPTGGGEKSMFKVLSLDFLAKKMMMQQHPCF